MALKWFTHQPKRMKLLNSISTQRVQMSNLKTCCHVLFCSMMLKTTTTLKNRRQDLDGFFLNVELTKILSPTIVWHFFDVFSANSKRHGDPLFMDEFWYFSAKCVEFDFDIFQLFDQSSNWLFHKHFGGHCWTNNLSLTLKWSARGWVIFVFVCDIRLIVDWTRLS